MGQDSVAQGSWLADLVADVTEGTETRRDVDIFSFDREVNEVSTEWAPHRKTDRPGLMRFESIRDRYVHRNVPAVVVVTDGRANRGPDPRFTAERLDVPHVFVGTGDTALGDRPRSFQACGLNEVAYLGNAFPVEVTAQARGAEGVPLTLRLTLEGKVLGAPPPWTPTTSFSSTTWTPNSMRTRRAP